jgi:hypothetical protein
MIMTIANWTLSVRLQRANTATASRPLNTLLAQARRQRLEHEVARERDHAQTQWLLLGGGMSR